jgi:hypothetical protein
MLITDKALITEKASAHNPPDPHEVAYDLISMARAF